MKTKTLSEICQVVKKEYVEGKICGEQYNGMCVVVYELNFSGKLSDEDYDRFMKEYRKFAKNRRLFYGCSGDKTKDSGQFAWPPKNRAARIKWLDQRI